MRIVVFGGSGFIGRSIMSMAGEGAISLGSKDVDLLNTDEAKAKLKPLLPEAAVIFGAGYPRARSDGFEAMADHQSIVENLIEAMRESPPRRVIFFSTVEVYGAPAILPITEDTPFRPDYFYAIGKVGCELLLQKHCRQNKIPLAILRLPGVYGPGDGKQSIIGKLVASATEGEVFKLFGNGSDRRDYVFVNDVAHVALHLANGFRGDVLINLVTGQSLSISDLIELIEYKFGPCNIERIAASGNHFDLEFDVARLRSVLPDVVMTPVELGLKAWKNENSHL
jgi:nucleoside-diphosphate-sugar epimerase